MRESTTGLAPSWGRSALPLPGVGTLTESQQRGTSCVWCGKRLTAETAVDLGERRIRVLDSHVTAFPRGCRPHTVKAARRALTDHVQRCEQCVDDPAECRTYTALRRLMREATTKPWKPVDIAFRNWFSHSITCRVCRVDDTRCERSKRLGQTWRAVRKAAKEGAGRDLRTL